MGRVDKGVACTVAGAQQGGEVAQQAADGGSGLSLGGDGRRVYLCQEHYKAWKKATKKTRNLERAQMVGQGEPK